ncbi:MAG: spore coat protein [Candidatus Doudnabacteria bacterium RIFCSPHIGHO2_01_FULL_50_11]|uniref:glucose-1-phosphate thymidylyltransferase n=1 Tax=Candidatus Doudnabacteria bacterium RIFCSPHIGHO2_01_FULL_50_11 TaxID=1817828 RepID=A0A1F5PE61_9BACT|nr:MAG: spore coat protein [Candidatus Doudnabacteria bacterium RIFCSPHIGHO2_01_FULL_50_11]HLC44619.1 sugar phosphate nucleotidyltransferase [Patescibacteria group bacterium]
MKGIILAGGNGTRLRPVTHVTNKHLLPVYDRPMIYFPLETMIACGFKDILIVSGKEHAGHFLNLLGSGKSFGVRLSYEVQEEAGGIAQALALGESFADEGSVAVHLGDNIFEHTKQLVSGVARFQRDERGAMIFVKEVPDPERFGVAEVDGERVVRIVEKPKKPVSNLCVTGFYIYDANVFSIIQKLKPSGRGELEITDVNNSYIERGTMQFEKVDGEWTDAGTFDSLLRASNLIAKKVRKE